jgi:hypothetical protein
MKDIGQYIVYKDGRVFNKKSQKYMTISKAKKYVTVYMYGKNVNLHRLLAELFISNPDNLPMVLHRDDDGYNYDIDNLYWGTMSDNVDDCKRNGKFVLSSTAKAKGEDRPNHKLSESDVIDILSSLDTNSSLGRKYGVSKETIRNIRIGKKWKHIKTQTGK